VTLDINALRSKLLAELLDRTRTASAAELEWLVTLLDAVRRPTDEWINPDSDIATLQFADAFAHRLRLFHVLHDPGEVLTKKGFEFAFKGASRAAGRDADIIVNATNAGADATVDGVRFSLKTEAAQGIRPDTITISKLMESAWTKDCDSIGAFLKVMPRVVAHMHQYDRILILRTFGRLATTGSVRYDLIEIPRSLLLNAQAVAEADFKPITKARGTTVSVSCGDGMAYYLVFDGSDQKVTIRGLPVSLCTTHASWTLHG
jgi:hypothetical protein